MHVERQLQTLRKRIDTYRHGVGITAHVKMRAHRQQREQRVRRLGHALLHIHLVGAVARKRGVQRQRALSRPRLQRFA
jgi:hypothetical protein